MPDGGLRVYVGLDGAASFEVLYRGETMLVVTGACVAAAAAKVIDALS